MSRVLVPGSVFAGDYRIVGHLSSGGMGAIYVAEQLSTRVQRALKVMRSELLADDEARRRFEQEARIAAGIASEHVVQVHAAGVDAQTGMPYLVMELLEGETLDALMRRRGALPPAEVREILGQVCHALGAAHSAGIVHRDLKPSNVFMAAAKRTNASFTVKVLDFGIAKLVSEHSATTAALGSPLWLAPEQTERSPVTPATDVWALGLLAYFLLTGRVFWNSAYSPQRSITEVMREILIEPIPSARQRAGAAGCQLPPSFDAWFACCVSRDPRARFADASQAFASLVQSYVPPEVGSGTAPATWNVPAPSPARYPLQAPLATPPASPWTARAAPAAGGLLGPQNAVAPTEGSWGAIGAAVATGTPQGSWGTPGAAGPGPSAPAQGYRPPVVIPAESGTAVTNPTPRSSIPGGCVVGAALGGAALFIGALSLGYLVWGRSSFIGGIPPAASADGNASPSTIAGGPASPATANAAAAVAPPNNPRPSPVTPVGSVASPDILPPSSPPPPGAAPPTTPPTPAPVPTSSPTPTPSPTPKPPVALPAPVSSSPPSTTSGAQPRARVRTLLGGDRISDFPSDAQSVVRSREPQWKGCYLRALGNDLTKHSDETMILWLTLAANGSISRVQTRIDSTPPGVGTCVVPIVQGMRFQPPQNPPLQANLIITFTAND